MNFRLLFLTFGLLATAVIGHAQTTFTINATPTANSLGYVTTQTYNFTFTLNTATNAGTSGGAASSDYYDWYDEFTFHPAVWTNVVGDGLAGAWQNPASAIADNASHLIATTPNSTFVSPHIPGASGGSFQLFAGADQTNIGLTATGKSVKSIYFDGDFTGLNFSNITGTLPDPNSYFANHLGTYATSQTFTGWIRTTDFDNAFFTINSLTIATSAVPEPSTYAAIAGAAMLGLAVWRRRRRQTRAVFSRFPLPSSGK